MIANHQKPGYYIGVGKSGQSRTKFNIKPSKKKWLASPPATIAEKVPDSIFFIFLFL